MSATKKYTAQHLRLLRLLSTQYPNRCAVYSKLINLTSELSLPKGTEHFISDIHGEYDAFRHIINNASGVIKDKVKIVLDNCTLKEKDELCTLIYYPSTVMKKLKQENRFTDEYIKKTIVNLISMCNFFSSKYSREKVRSIIKTNFSYIIDEMMHSKSDEDHIQKLYHEKILQSIVETGSSELFIRDVCELIKTLAVAKLHVLGDIFDRGPSPDKCMDVLSSYHHLDLQWGNHDVLWMGAACGSGMCIVNVLLNNLRYNNYKMLENGYGISLRKLVLFSTSTYKDEPGYPALQKALSVLGMKLVGAIVDRHPEYNLQELKLFDHIDLKRGTLKLADGNTYHLNFTDMPTVNENAPYQLSDGEQELMEDLISSFTSSVRLREHIQFLFTKGDMYKCYNGNLLYHGCVPLDEKGQFLKIKCNNQYLSGRDYLNFCQTKIREGYLNRDDDHLDFFWYMWTAPLSPLSGRRMKIFEKLLIKEESVLDEPRNPYYEYYHKVQTCEMILKEFGLNPKKGHIINGHTPIMAKKGESPIRARGKLLVIDGGFCRAYQDKTGIAGYTLIYNSHCLHLKAHTPFTNKRDAIDSLRDIEDIEELSVEEYKPRKLVADTDWGAELKERVRELKDLLDLYENGVIAEKLTK